MEKCDSRTRAYKNGKTFDQCKEIAKALSLEMGEKITQEGHIGWDLLLERAQHDELVYKLVLKFLRQDGFDIGDWKNPYVKKITL